MDKACMLLLLVIGVVIILMICILQVACDNIQIKLHRSVHKIVHIKL